MRCRQPYCPSTSLVLINYSGEFKLHDSSLRASKAKYRRKREQDSDKHPPITNISSFGTHSSVIVERLIRIRRRWARSFISFRQSEETKPKEEKKKKKKKMEWLRKMLFPMRRVLLGIAGKVRARRRGRGLLKLYNDVQSCGYQDVQVMWEMLQKSETTSSPKRQRSTWKICIWAAHPR
ncbi:hypothetical protein SUGI_0762940 [Cryptomeria japonica]|nr:hypothetical protein SUGI_0762940 [Cryptomeria japonica]